MDDNSKLDLSSISIALVDDHEVVLEGYASFLHRNGMQQTETFSRARQLLDRVGKKHFDVYIVDVELQDMDAYTLIDSIRSLHPEARFVISTIHDEPWTVSKLTKKNVNAVVYKSGNMQQLMDAVKAVHYGKVYFCTEFKKIRNHLDIQPGNLTQREQDVVIYMAQGLSTKNIANKLFLSENTVENHRKSIFRKMHVKNAVEMMVKAIAMGYIDPQNLNSP